MDVIRRESRERDRCGQPWGRRSAMRHVVPGCLVVALAVLVFSTSASVVTRAQSSADEIYVVAQNPTALHAFHYDSATQALVEDNLDPSSAGPALKVGVDSTALAVTDRFFVLGDNLTDLALSVVDPVTGVQIARPETTTASGAQVLASADGQYSFEIANGPGGGLPPVLSVVDLRPTSSTFGREEAELPMPLLPTSSNLAGDAFAPGKVAALDASGHLFVAWTEAGPAGYMMRILTVDVSNPLAPSLVASATTPESPASGSQQFRALRVATIGGVEYLLAAVGNVETVPRQRGRHVDLRADTGLHERGVRGPADGRRCGVRPECGRRSAGRRDGRAVEQRPGVIRRGDRGV